MTPRWVLHVDLDQFQAAVEVRRRPELAGLPIIVGGNGDPNEPRKVVTCASYPARKFGVHAGMPLRTAARKCPDATFLPLDTAAYDEASEEVMSLLRDFGHPVEVWGWDEAYMGADVEDPVELAQQIREVIAGGTELSCSVGISDNKQRAKVATGFGKPAGIYQLTDENWMAVMGDREVDALWGVGPKTAKKLAGMGITTVADLAATDATLLTSTFGPTTGLWILLLAKGGGDSNVSVRTVGGALAQPRHHLRRGPDRPRRNRLRCSRTRAADAHRDRGPRSRRHPGSGDRAHQHVLHQDQDPQAAVAERRWRGDHQRQRWTCSTCSNSTDQSDCSASGWNSILPKAGTKASATKGATLG